MIKKAFNRIITIALTAVITITSLNIQTLTTYAAAVKPGYHLEYHNNGEWSKYDKKIPGCTDYETDSKTCYHYRKWIIHYIGRYHGLSGQGDSIWNGGFMHCEQGGGNILALKPEQMADGLQDGSKYAFYNFHKESGNWVWEYYGPAGLSVNGETQWANGDEYHPDAGKDAHKDIRFYYWATSEPTCNFSLKGKYLREYCWRWKNSVWSWGYTSVKYYGADGSVLLNKLSADEEKCFSASWVSFNGLDDELNYHSATESWNNWLNSQRGNFTGKWNIYPYVDSHVMTRYKCKGHEVANQYTIKYDANGGTGTINGQTATYDKNISLSNGSKFSKSGYRIVGWSKTKSGAVDYNLGQSVKNLTTANNDAVTLYAVWEPDTFKLDLNGYLDGESKPSIAGFGTVDVYVNGVRIADDITDFYQDITYGAKYELKDIKATTGHTYKGVHSGSTSGTMNSTKTLVLEFTTNYYNLKINKGTGISAISGTGISSTNNPSSTKYGSSVTINATVKPGYTWKNWTGTFTTTTKNYTFNMPAKDVTLTANATPNNDTPYKVEHYKQNISDNNYTLADTDYLKGTTDTKVTPAVKNYAGFTAPSTQTVNIDGDGSRVVKYYYTRNSYTLTLNKGVGISSVSGGGTKKYDSSVTIDATVIEGYTWKNWTGTYTKTDKKTTFNMPAQNVTLTANATANTYYVDYEKGLTNKGGTTSKTTHTYNQDVILAANGFTGRSYALYFDANKPKNGFGQTTSSVLSNLPSTQSGNLTFNKWSVSATYNSGTYSASTNLGKKNFESTNGATAHATALWNNKTLTWGNPSLVGYTFTGWYYSNNTKVNTDNSNNKVIVTPDTSAYNTTVYAHWSPNTNTPYKVEHWVQKVTDSFKSDSEPKEYELIETENFTGTTDTLVTPAIKKYNGCIAPAVQTVNIDGDGSTVVRYYYNRVKITLDINAEYLGKYYSTNIPSTFDVYVNDRLIAKQVRDYYSNQILYGSTWDVRNINPDAGRHYYGVDVK